MEILNILVFVLSLYTMTFLSEFVLVLLDRILDDRIYISRHQS